MKNTIDKVIGKIVPAPPSSCMLWTGATDPDGYGLIKWQGKTIRVTRLLWSELRGPIPSGMCVLHRCDTPTCSNIEHLFLGTRAENRADCIAKGRQAIGPFVTRTMQTGDRHWSRRMPERVRRGKDHPNYGKSARGRRGPDGRYVRGA